MSESCDVLVLGAGMVGVSAAIHLQRRGRSVALMDRRAPGEETSYGNAGVIEGGTYVPLAFPTDPRQVLRYATNRQTAVHFHWSFLPRIASWLAELAVNSSEGRLRDNGGAIMTLLAHAIAEHRKLLADSGADSYLHETGWMRLYRSDADFAADTLERRIADETGITYDVLSAETATELEPHLRPAFAKAVHWHQLASVSDPGAVTKAYAARFIADGGELVTGEASRLVPAADGWRIETSASPVAAREVVVALGPWSMDLLRPLGYRFPLAVKRGYHRHYKPFGNASLGRPVIDDTHGFALAPMTRGIRVTTGVEFADRDAPKTPVQLERAEARARELFPLGEGVEDEPWMGRRPCFPDSKPVVGPAPKHKGLWLDFGHAHLGLTLGPVSGRLLAEQMTGETPLVDPAPFAATRF